MKILVTGGAGYIGTTLIPYLLERKYKVTVLDNLMYGGAPILPFFSDKNFNFEKGDIRDIKKIKEISKDKDIVIHLAAIVGFPACRNNPKLANDVNYEGSKNVSAALSKNQLIIYSSTSSNYGALTDKICTEDSRLNPLSIYGKTKTAGEKYLMDNSTCIGFRFATGFGVSPRLRLDLLINEFTYLAIKQKYLVVYESNFLRTFIHVKDMARSILFAIDNYKLMKNQVFNVGSEKMNYSKKDVCKLIKKETGSYIHYADVGSDADKRNYIVSYQKINKLGYETKISLKDGIAELAKALSVVNVHNPYTNI